MDSPTISEGENYTIDGIKLVVDLDALRRAMLSWAVAIANAYTSTFVGSQGELRHFHGNIPATLEGPEGMQGEVLLNLRYVSVAHGLADVTCIVLPDFKCVSDIVRVLDLDLNGRQPHVKIFDVTWWPTEYDGTYTEPIKPRPGERIVCTMPDRGQTSSIEHSRRLNRLFAQ